MADNKKSFVAYTSWGNVFDSLDDIEAGRLIKHLFNYVRDLNPEPPDKLTLVAFQTIKDQLKSDLVKWEQIRVKRSEAGTISSNKKKQNLTNSTHVKSVKQNLTNSTVSDSVNVIVNDNEKKEDNMFFSFKFQLLKMGIPPNLVEDFMKVRKNKKAADTETSFKRFINEVKKSNKTLEEIVTLCVEKDWKGFQFEWISGYQQTIRPNTPKYATLEEFNGPIK